MIGKTSRDPSPSARTPASPRSPRQVQVLLILLVAALVGVVAGVLSHAAGNNVPAAVLTAGGAFAGATCLLLAIAHYTAAE